MARFKYTDNSQGQFIQVNLQEQLLLGSFERTIDYLINTTDLSLFEKNYKNDEKGAAAYPPGIIKNNPVLLFKGNNIVPPDRKSV